MIHLLSDALRSISPRLHFSAHWMSGWEPGIPLFLPHALVPTSCRLGGESAKTAGEHWRAHGHGSAAAASTVHNVSEVRSGGEKVLHFHKDVGRCSVLPERSLK